jgi:signal transduction histidine kinase
MFASRRAAALDLTIAGFVTVVTTVLAWSDASFFGEPLEGPRLVARALPLLIGVPLALRRTRPLLVWCLVMGGIATQSVVSGVSPEGLHCVVALFVGAYSVAAYSPRRRAFIGLAVLVAGYVPYTLYVPGIGKTGPGDEWATAFFGTMSLACWLLGFGVHGRREELALESRTRQLEGQAAATLQEERGRIARELHDIVSHRLIVVVVQAAGARARDGAATETLEKIEGQAREALVEMRRMLGLLRADDGDASVAPPPGITDLAALVTSVGEAGLPCELVVTGDLDSVPKAVGLSAYRIVQESLTNALRHAGARHGRVLVAACGDRLEVTVTDDGRGIPDSAPVGHGLTGMRERALLLGGELDVASTSAGVRVHAVLPLAGSA